MNVVSKKITVIETGSISVRWDTRSGLILTIQPARKVPQEWAIIETCLIPCVARIVEIDSHTADGSGTLSVTQLQVIVRNGV